MSFAVRDQLERIGREYVDDVVAATGALPDVECDDDWPSPCIVGTSPAGRSLWRPVAMEEAPDFSGLQRALECPLQVDFLTFFGSFWSAALPVSFHGNAFELLQLWNRQDFDNLVANLIGHALEKRRIRQPLSLFFALVDDERFLSIDNAGGDVYLETVGKRRMEEVAPSLAQFLEGVEVAKKSPP